MATRRRRRRNRSKGLKTPFDFVVNESDDKFVFEIDLPGVDDAGVTVQFQGNKMIITAERGDSQAIDRYNIKRREVRASDATAEIGEGVLVVTIPKDPEESDVEITVTPASD